MCVVRAFCSRTARTVALVTMVAILGGCTAAHHRRAADKETYGIVQDVEKQIFGTNSGFNIDTRYSDRRPKTVLPEEIISDRSSTNLRVLNLEDALGLAVENSREYQTQKEQLYLTALQLTGARYAFSPQFFADSQVSVRGVGEHATPVTIGSQVGVGQLLQTGGRISAALANDIVLFYTGKNPGQIVNLISVNLTQPLLRGFGRNSPAVEALTQSVRNVIYGVRSFNLYQQEFDVGIVRDYFRLLTQKDQVRNNYRDYTNRIETVAYLEARSIDRETTAAVDDARTAELQSKNRYVTSLASYLNTLDAFKIRLGLPVSERIYLDDADLRELIQQGEVSVDIGRDAAFQMALARQMEILNAIDQFEDSKRRIRVAADQFKPGLNLIGGASLASDPPDDYTRFSTENINWNVGLQLDLPIDRFQERNAYRRVLIQYESQLRSLSLTLDQYRNRVDSGLRTIEEARLNLLNGVEQLRVAERRVDNEAMRLEAGRNTIRDLREAQDALIQAQNSLANLYTGYLGARLDLLVDIGAIDTAPPKFWLRDPIAQTLTPEQRGASPLRMPDDAVVPPETFLEPRI